MASLLSVKKENSKEMESKESKLTPELIRDKLFYFRDAAHLFHQETKGGWEHDALGKLYEGITEFEDDIPEKIMGYMGGKRLGKLAKISLPEYVDHNDSVDLAKELIEFSYELYEWAGEKKFCDIENLAQSLSGLGAKAIYRLSLKG